MSIETVGSPATANVPTTAQTGMSDAAKTTGMDYNAFLKLLVAEMQNQDPLKPTDSSEYVAQFATFSNVEQAIQSNRKLDALMSVAALSAAGSLVGRTATTIDGATTGTIASVRMDGAGMIATLEDGTAIPLGPGTILE